MKKETAPVSYNDLKHHLLSDLKCNLRGVALCSLFLFLVITVTGKVCPFRLFFGIPCPGCGLTRAGILLIKGDIHGSLLINPFLLPLLAGIPLFLYEHYILGRKARLFSYYSTVCISLMAAMYLIRMKYWFPDRPPMIYEPDNLLQLLFTILKS